MILNRFDENKPAVAGRVERHGAILMAWPHCHTQTGHICLMVRQCYRNITAEIVKEEHVILLAQMLSPVGEMPAGVTVVEMPTA